MWSSATAGFILIISEKVWSSAHVGLVLILSEIMWSSAPLAVPYHKIMYHTMPYRIVCFKSGEILVHRLQQTCFYLKRKKILPVQENLFPYLSSVICLLVGCQGGWCNKCPLPRSPEPPIYTGSPDSEDCTTVAKECTMLVLWYGRG